MDYFLSEEQKSLILDTLNFQVLRQESKFVS
jgi:hypothetical protein